MEVLLEVTVMKLLATPVFQSLLELGCEYLEVSAKSKRSNWYNTFVFVRNKMPRQTALWHFVLSEMITLNHTHLLLHSNTPF